MRGNADLLREFYARVEADEIDRAVEIFTPDIEIRTRLESHRGLESCRRMLAEAFSDFEAHLEITEVVEPAPETVMASYVLRLRGLHSGIESSQGVVDVAHFRGGHVFLVEVFSDTDEALASIGR